MFEEDDEGYSLEFFSQSIGLNLVLALILAPIIPGWVAQDFLVGVIGLALIACLLFTWCRWQLLKLAARSEVNSSIQTLISEEAAMMFRVVGTTTLALMLALGWLGFAKLLWVFESFFVIFAAIHIASAVVYTLLSLVEIREEINELPSRIHGTQPDKCSDDSEPAD